MNGVHDMGGMHGFGPIDPEPDEPVFHAPWEARVYALCSAFGPVSDWTLDADRYATETIPGEIYLSVSYYEKWFLGLRSLLLARGYASEPELANGKSETPAKASGRILKADKVNDYVHNIGLSSREAETERTFSVGATVRARNTNPPGHTRLPRYVRGRIGTIERVHGCHIFPDANAHGQGEQPHWLYSVRFTARELWGDRQPADTDVFVDLWEPYLELA